jgi:hemerythrin-like metal-binding protein
MGMAVFTWDDSLKTGIEEIDAQHRKLIELINGLNEAMLARQGKEALGAVLAGLREYVQYHFRYEESLLERHGYGKLAEQASAHADYVKKLEEFEAKREGGELGLSVRVLDFLMEWIKGHIMGEDMLYVPFLKEKGL